MTVLAFIIGMLVGIALVAVLQKGKSHDDEPRLNFIEIRCHSLMYFISTRDWGVVGLIDGKATLMARGETPRRAIDRAAEVTRG